jgi:glyoxylase-like metal-dependent hydrolase (beta-lactamase superfamily II)
MIRIKTFVFNPFQENTYLVYDETNQCLLIDPGCHFEQEQQELTRFIRENNLEPQYILHTHGHIDHVLGINYLKQTFQLKAAMHPADLEVLRQSKEFGRMVGLDIEQPVDPDILLEDNQSLEMGNTSFTVLHVPGHSPGSIALYHSGQGVLFSGDALFRRGIGRTDLMGGDYMTLVQSIQNKLFTLPEHTLVYPGHGETTTIGEEKKENPVLG